MVDPSLSQPLAVLCYPGCDVEVPAGVDDRLFHVPHLRHSTVRAHHNVCFLQPFSLVLYNDRY